MQSIRLSILLVVVCSAIAEAQRRSGSGISGGTITPRATAWVEYDDRTGVVLVLNQEWRVPRRDSALVLLVDRIDRVGGDPIVEAVMVRVSPLAEPQHGPDAIGRDSVEAVYAHWNNA